MDTSLLSICIISCKIVSLTCLFFSLYSSHWFEIDDYSVNKHLLQKLCFPYGAFCDTEDQVSLPSLIIIIPCLLTALGLLFELINLCLLCTLWNRVRSLLNFFLEHTSIALSCAMTIHCVWVTTVHIRISMEMPIVHLGWTFFAFALATILIPLDAICSIARVLNNCQYERVHQAKHSIQAYTCRHKSIMESDI